MKLQKFVFIFILFFSYQINAATGLSFDESIVEIKDDFLGVEIKLDKNGRLVSARSTIYQAVNFTDRRGINKAYVVAEEKAKGQLARFMSQEVMSSRVIKEIENESGKSTISSGNSASSWTKENVRSVTETLTEINGSFARGNFRGITTIARSYDEKKEEVMVTIGLNKDTARAAGALKSGFEDSPTNNNPSSSGKFPSQPSEGKVSKDFNKF